VLYIYKKRALVTILQNAFLTFLLLCSILSLRAQTYDFEIYDHLDGLLESSIKKISRSSNGDIYILSSTGINFYDGFSFQLLDIPPGYGEYDSFAIDENDIMWLVPKSRSGLEDDQISSLIAYDLKTEKTVAPYELIEDQDSILFKNSILNVYSNQYGQIIVSGRRKKYILEENNIRLHSIVEIFQNRIRHQQNEYVLDPSNPIIQQGNGYEIKKVIQNSLPDANNKIQNKFIEKVIERTDPNQRINSRPYYNSTDHSLTFFNDKIIQSSIQVKDSMAYLNFQDSNYVYSVKIELDTFSIDTFDIKSAMKYQSITDALRTGNDEIWLGTTNGLVKINKSTLQFKHFAKNNSFRGIIQLSEDSIFLNSYGGCFIYEPSTERVSKITSRFGFSSIRLNQNQILLGPASVGLYNFELSDSKINYFARDEIDGAFDLIKLTDSTFLSTSRTGIKKGIQKGKDFKIEPIFEDQIIRTTKFFCPSQDPNEVFVTFKTGFAKINISQNGIESYPFLKDKTVTYIYQDAQDLNVLWIGTGNNGLYRINQSSMQINNWTRNSGLTNSNIHSIYEDQKKRLWISTNFGLNCLNKTSFEIEHFFDKNESPITEFNRNSSLQLEDGTLVFGSINGFIHFDPNFDFQYPKSKKTKFFKYSYIDTKTNSLNEQELGNETKISITRHHRNFKLFLKSNTLQDRSVYKYSYKENEEFWNFTAQGLIEIDKLDVDNHTIYVSKKISNTEWTSPIRFTIDVDPPFYLNRWYWVGALLLLLASIILWIAQRNRLMFERNKKIEQEVKDKTKQVFQKNEQLEHMNQTNEILFSILSHDLRTPIMSMTRTGEIINRLLETKDEKVAKVGETIENRSKKLLVMLENLMEWTQIQKRMGSFVFTEVHIESLISSIINELSDEISEKNIHVSFKNPIEKHYLETDSEAMKVILRNVMTNAIKFSVPGSEIEVSYDSQKSSISIKDFAGGIPQHIITRLKNNQKINSTANRSGEVGLGIGLQISKYLLNGIGGRLEFDVENNIGTTTHIIIEKKEGKESTLPS